MSETAVNIHHYVKETKVLGPGTRSALWVSGCHRHCAGCLASEFEHEAQEVKVDELVKVFGSITSTEGITISGGEPFNQAKPLAQLVDRLKNGRDYSVIIYTGYRIEELHTIAETDNDVKRLIELTDILIDGEYIRELDDGRAYVGSSNQRVLFLSDRYLGTNYYNAPSRKIEMYIDGNVLSMTGIPDKNQLESWKKIKSILGGANNG